MGDRARQRKQPQISESVEEEKGGPAVDFSKERRTRMVFLQHDSSNFLNQGQSKAVTVVKKRLPAIWVPDPTFSSISNNYLLPKQG